MPMVRGERSIEWERIEKSIKQMDATFTAVSGLVFGCLTAVTTYAVIELGATGIVFMFIAWIIAIPLWARLVKTWMNERLKLLKERLEAKKELDIAEEIAKLRESIEALRKSLES